MLCRVAAQDLRYLPLRLVLRHPLPREFADLAELGDRGFEVAELGFEQRQPPLDLVDQQRDLRRVGMGVVEAEVVENIAQ